MKQTAIQFYFDETKLEAISIYLKAKDGTLSKELEDFMESLYRKTVPIAVREFIEKKATRDCPETSRLGRKATASTRKNVDTIADSASSPLVES